MPKLTVYCVERLFWNRILPTQKVSDPTGSGSKILQTGTSKDTWYISRDLAARQWCVAGGRWRPGAPAPQQAGSSPAGPAAAQVAAAGGTAAHLAYGTNNILYYSEQEKSTTLYTRKVSNILLGFKCPIDIVGLAKKSMSSRNSTKLIVSIFYDSCPLKKILWWRD